MQFELTHQPPSYILPEFPLPPLSTLRAEKTGLPAGHHHIATVSSHLGKAPYWYFEMERHSPYILHPRDQRFIPVEDALRAFEQETGIALPAITLYYQHGVRRYESGEVVKVDEPNPLDIVPGRAYVLKKEPSSLFTIEGRYVGVESPYGPALVRTRQVDGHNPGMDAIQLRHLSRDQVGDLVKTNLSLDAKEAAEEKQHGRQLSARPRN